MKFEYFKKIIEIYRKANNELSELHDLGFDFYEGKFNLCSHYENLIDIFFKVHYDIEGIQTIYWFMFENNYGEGGLEMIYEGQRVCEDLESLHSYLEEHNKL